MKHHIKKTGFTLVEMILYMGLLSIFLFVLTDILVESLDVRTDSTASAYVVSDGEFIRNRLQYDLRRNATVIMPASVGQTTASLQMTISGQTYVYASSSGNLILTQGGVAQQLNTSNTTLTNFSVTRVGNGTGEDTFEVSYGLASTDLLRGQPAESKTYALTIGTR